MSSEFVQFKSADPKASFNLLAADRDLDEKEKEAEEKAEKFSLKAFPRLNPIPGRIGFFLRNLHSDVGTRNQMVITYIELVEGGAKRKFVRTLMIWWNNLDDYSKRRVDIFDLFCEKYKINRSRLWAVIQEGMYVSNEAITRTALDGFKPKFIEVLTRMAQKERNLGDRKIIAEAIGLIGGDAPVINDNRKITNQTLNVSGGDASSPIPSFADSIRRSDKSVRKAQPVLEEKIKPRELGEGEQNYLIVDGHIVGEDELELLPRKEKNEDEDLDREIYEAGKEL